jgi:hypothetical protein
VSGLALETAVSGFFDASGARMVLRRLKIRRALMDARASIEGLLNCLDESIQADRDESSALFNRAVALDSDDVDRRDGCLPINIIDRKDVREKELLDGVNLVLQLLDTLGVGLRHGLFSSEGSGTSAAPGDGGHSLCDAPKYGDAA